jgi:hypothetical protein
VKLAADRGHEVPRDPEPEPGPDAEGLRREERLEDALQVLGIDPAAGVGDLDDHPAVRVRARAHADDALGGWHWR